MRVILAAFGVVLFLVVVLPGSAQYDGHYDTHRVPYRLRNNKVIFVDSATMAPITGKQWEDAYWYDGLSDYGQVKENGKWGIVNSREELVISPEYDFVDVINGTIILRKDSSFFIRDQQLNDLIPPGYRINDLSYHPLGYFWLYQFIARDTVCALLNRSGKLLIPFGRFDAVKGFPWLGYIAVKKNGFWGLSDTLGHPITPFMYEGLFLDDQESHGIIVQTKGKAGVIGKRGEVIIPMVYDDIRFFYEGLAAVKKGTKWGYIDRQNVQKLLFRFSGITDFYKGTALVSEDGIRKGFINIQGEWVIPAEYDHLSKDNRIIYHEKKGYGVMDPNGKRITEPIYGNAEPFAEGLSLVSTFVRGFENWGFIDTNGVVVIPFHNYLKRSPAERLGGLVGGSYARGANSFHLGFSRIMTWVYSGKKLVETRVDYYMDRFGRKYSEKED
jgi:hypothetical protein